MVAFAVLIDDLGIEFAEGRTNKKNLYVRRGSKMIHYHAVEVRALSLDHSTTGTVKGAAWGLVLAGPVGLAVGSMVGGGPRVAFEIDTTEGETLRCVASRGNYLAAKKEIEQHIANRAKAAERDARRLPERGDDNAALVNKNDQARDNSGLRKFGGVVCWIIGAFSILVGLLAFGSPTTPGSTDRVLAVGFILAGLLVLPPAVATLRKQLPFFRPIWVPPSVALAVLISAAAVGGSNTLDANGSAEAGTVTVSAVNSTEDDKVKITAAAKELWDQITSEGRPCDTAAENVAALAGRRNPDGLHPATRRASLVCSEAGTEVGRIAVPDAIPREARGAFREAVETCRNAYYAKSLTYDLMAKVLNENSRPSALNDAQQASGRSQAATAQCALDFMKAVDATGIPLEDFKDVMEP